ncbi:hypothetical protein [Burkholderia stagnalis]|uniref:Uncharacterized protein n=1 Tax=Burkholderia stagnalis TaxID=1503054 RepID=A0ABX9YU34_9BURK|nr:hypothetical protein [Burkholderia stagnalis]RQQ63081.1 hypothetical protein DF137_27185 [Burkholderia stagnalis]RQQ63507.1 hypothetical protein DF158_06535 [Burkholderia stagnalis]RQQ67576.1 hypothetical protein DF139_20490 [Burkholderia stagnalis]RQQ76980.1 hypothetical protein DF138_26795 [Burkholderia stagnalis]RQQ84808.1 hypothetical protein DF136_26300 [Burkholderia stagnalis]
MKHSIASLSVVLAAVFGTVAHAARAEDIPLGMPDGFIASSVDKVADGQYCVTGEVMDEMGTKHDAWVALVDAGAKRVAWRTRLPFERPYVGNDAVRCAAGQGAYFVLTQERTHIEESLNQTKVVLNKLGADGKLLKREPVGAGFDEWAYLLDVDGNAVAVAGGTSDALEHKGKLGNYVARFDTQLARTSLTAIPNGAFWTGTTAALSANQLRVAGQFMPNAGGASGGREGFAVSRINVDQHKYQSSTYVSPPDARVEASAFGADGAAYYVATTPAALSVAVVSPAGKLAQQFTTRKIVCDLASIGVTGSTITVIGTTCDKPAAGTLATIDLSTRQATTTRRIAGDVRVARVDGNAWVGVVDAGKRGLVLRRDAP